MSVLLSTRPAKMGTTVEEARLGGMGTLRSMTTAGDCLLVSLQVCMLKCLHMQATHLYRTAPEVDVEVLL
jgi:hypothetical protein